MSIADWNKIESFEWDEGNKNKNRIKHKVNIQETEEIFANKPLQIVPDQKHSKTEARYVAFGITNKHRKLSVFFTIRKNCFRIISARDQSRKEKKEYEKNKINS